MNTIQKSEILKNGLRKGFQDGSSKMAKRKCFGYDVGSDGELSINPEEAHEKHTGRVLLQKTVSTGAVQIENDGLTDRYLYTDTHEAIISDEMFMAVQQEKLSRSKEPQNHVTMKLPL